MIRSAETHDEDDSLMISGFIESLELENFKSYRGRHVLGPFQPFMAIIGPNHAGKSNIIDALSFVLGAKADPLRVKDLRDLICREEDVQRCSVSLRFHKYIDDSSVVFKREISVNAKSGRDVSVFTVDGQVVEKSLYVEQLRNLSIPETKYFLFDVNSVAGKNGMELSRFFEEINGSDGLIREYEDAKKAKEEAEERTMSAFSKKKGLGAEKRQCKAWKDEADHFLELTRRRNRTAVNLVMCQLRSVTTGVTKLKDTVDRLNAEKNSIEHDIRKREDDMSTVRSELEQLAKHDSKLRAAAKKYQEEADELDSEVIRAQEDAAHSERVKEKLESQLKTLEDEIREHDEKMKQLQNELADLKAVSASMDSEQVELTDEQRAEFREVQTQASNLAGPLRAELEREQRQFAQCETKNGTICRNIEQLDARVTQLNDMNKKYQQQRQKVLEERQIVDSRLNENNADLQKYHAMCAADESLRRDLEEKLDRKSVV